MYIYEIRMNSYLGRQDTSIGEYYKSKEKAEDQVRKLNTFINLYYVNKVKLEDADE